MSGIFIAACDLTDEQIQVFAIQADGTIMTRWKTSADPNSAWTPWSNFQGIPSGVGATTICAGTLPDRRPQLFATDASQNTWSCWKTTTNPSAAWTPWSAF